VSLPTKYFGISRRETTPKLFHSQKPSRVAVLMPRCYVRISTVECMTYVVPRRHLFPCLTVCTNCYFSVGDRTRDHLAVLLSDSYVGVESIAKQKKRRWTNVKYKENR
jgi:hypothetical protein